MRDRLGIIGIQDGKIRTLHDAVSLLVDVAATTISSASFERWKFEILGKVA